MGAGWGLSTLHWCSSPGACSLQKAAWWWQNFLRDFRVVGNRLATTDVWHPRGAGCPVAAETPVSCAALALLAMPYCAGGRLLLLDSVPVLLCAAALLAKKIINSQGGDPRTPECINMDSALCAHCKSRGPEHPGACHACGQ